MAHGITFLGHACIFTTTFVCECESVLPCVRILIFSRSCRLHRNFLPTIISINDTESSGYRHFRTACLYSFFPIMSHLTSPCIAIRFSCSPLSATQPVTIHTNAVVVLPSWWASASGCIYLMSNSQTKATKQIKMWKYLTESRAFYARGCPCRDHQPATCVQPARPRVFTRSHIQGNFTFTQRRKNGLGKY